MLSYVQLFATPWSVALHAPLSMGFSRQEYWSRLPCSPPGDLSNPGMEPTSPALACGFFTTEPHEKLSWVTYVAISVGAENENFIQTSSGRSDLVRHTSFLYLQICATT